jgi:hypothetical protein
MYDLLRLWRIYHADERSHVQTCLEASLKLGVSTTFILKVAFTH